MPTKRQQGSGYELEVQKYLEGQGYKIHRAYASLFKIGNKTLCRSNDIFSVVDIIAKKKDHFTKWIQVSTGTRRAEKEKKLKGIGDIWTASDSVELWLRFDNKVWKIYRYQQTEQGKEFVEVAKIERGKYFEITDK